MDNDAYGHINNVVYYSWFDTAVNAWLIGHGALDVRGGRIIGLVVETGCNYFSPLAFPQAVEAGIRVSHVGRSSVRFEMGVFARAASMTSASGHFTHVYVDRENQRPVELPIALRTALKAIE